MTQLFLFIGLGGQEIMLIALVVLLIFGGKKIPELMKGLGQGVKSFKTGMKEESAEEKLLNQKKMIIGNKDESLN